MPEPTSNRPLRSGARFVATGASHEVADPDWGGEYSHVEGYREASRRILAGDMSTYELDSLVYSVVFLHRLLPQSWIAGCKHSRDD